MSKLRILGCLLLLGGCGSGDTSAKPASGDANAAVVADALTKPETAALTATVPDSFVVVFTTSKGNVEVLVHRAWSPLGADRVHYLAAHGFFSGARFFRVLHQFVAQFGLSGNPTVDAAFKPLTLQDERPKVSNTKGTLVFSNAGPNTRTTQLFINLADNAMLDEQGFAPVGKVVKGMEVVEQLFSGYGQIPDAARIESEGNKYLRGTFPNLDSIVATMVKRK